MTSGWSATRRRCAATSGASSAGWRRSIPFAEDLLTAYYCAFDRHTPTHVRVALLGALAYFISPFDFVPDMLPIVGLTDDAAVLATAIKLVWDNIQPVHREAASATLARLERQRALIRRALARSGSSATSESLGCVLIEDSSIFA